MSPQRVKPVQPRHGPLRHVASMHEAYRSVDLKLAATPATAAAALLLLSLLRPAVRVSPDDFKHGREQCVQRVGPHSRHRGLALRVGERAGSAGKQGTGLAVAE